MNSGFIISIIVAIFLMFYLTTHEDKMKVHIVQCNESLSIPVASSHVPTQKESLFECSKELTNASR